jgi:rhamnopyranosyl-N-acetylglucosaminyl-diphospho-decaprenol beta-1,3/1,4-galactofuranosyltransferase
MYVCAVVVTYNRRDLLRECLAALEAQTRQPDHILVVDNASTDGTLAMLRDEHPGIEVVALSTNQGGAGGFHEGLRRAHAAGVDWVWLMDDDTMPAATALDELLRASRGFDGCAPALLSSRVIWTDGRLHPMNYQGFERQRTDAVIEASQRALMPLRTATFVSLLIHRHAVDRHGLPLKRYFLWSDDIEYTARLLREEPGYLVPASVAVHKTEHPYTAVSASGDRFYFHVRNTLYMLRGTAWRPSEKPSLLFGLIVSVGEYLRYNRFAARALPVVLRGLRDGLRPGPPTPAKP